MRKLILFIFIAASPCLAQTWGPNTGLPVDVLVDMNTSSPGTALTDAIANAGTISAVGHTASWAGIASGGSFSPTFLVGANQSKCPNLGPVLINGSGGSLFPADTLLYNNLGHQDGDPGAGSNAQMNVASGTAINTVLFCVNLNLPTSESNPNDLDFLGMWQTPSGNYAMAQLNAQSSGGSTCVGIPAGTVGIRVEGKPTTHTPCIALKTPGTYWVAMNSNWTAGSVKMEVWTAEGTQVRCIAGIGGGSGAGTCNSDGTIAIPSGLATGGTLNYITFGNNEVGSNNGTITYVQNLMLNLSGTWPFFWTEGDVWNQVLSPSRGSVWGPPDSTNDAAVGVVNGIPTTRAQCSTAACVTAASTSATTAQITAALASAPANTVVLLSAGTYTNATGSPSWSGVNNVTLRGAGADQTIFLPTGQWNLGSGGLSATGPANLTTWVPGGGVGQTSTTGVNPFTLTISWPRGLTELIFAAVPNLKIGQIVILDQLDPSTDYGGPLIAQQASCTSLPCATPVSPGIAGPYATQGEGSNYARPAGNSGCGGSTPGIEPCWSQQQVVTITSCGTVSTVGSSCSGTNVPVTISPPLEMATWGYDLGGNSLTPSAWWSSNATPQFDGIEDLQLNMANCSGCVGISMNGALNDWVKGVAIINGAPVDHGLIQTAEARHLEFRNNYIFGGITGSTGVYGIDPVYCFECLVENNIVQGLTTPYIFNGGGCNTVFGYDYAINGFYTQSTLYNIPARGDHGSGVCQNLTEELHVNGHTLDTIHGTANLETDFRNHFWGQYPVCANSSSYSGAYGSCTQNMTPISDSPFRRFNSFIGNVLGTINIQTNYTTNTFESGGGPYAIFQYGGQNFGFVDPIVQQTAMVWGNVDAFHGFTFPQFNCSEVMEGTAFTTLNYVWIPFYNLCPTSNTLPSSFYYSSTPSWWPSSKPFPATGPDVTGGNEVLCSSGTYSGAYVNNVSLCSGGTGSTAGGGHVNSIPAEDAFFLCGGNPYGTGGPLSFNESRCFPTGSLPQASAPACLPGSETVNPTQPVTVTCQDISPGTVICVTIDGSAPATNQSTGCANGTQLISGITFTVSGIVNFRAIAGGTNYSDSTIANYQYKSDSELPVIQTF